MTHVPHPNSREKIETVKTDPTHFATPAELPVRLRFARVLGRQRWVRGPLRKSRDHLLNTLCAAEKARGYLFEIDYFGQRYRGNLNRFTDYMAFCYGSAAPSELGLLQAAIRYLKQVGTKPICFADVGANVGHHTLFMAAQVDSVIAFEPFPPVLALLRQHLAINCIGNVEVVPFALGENDDTIAFFPGTEDEDTIGTFLNWNAPQGDVQLELPVRNGDRLFAECNFPAINLLKVDVEGFEPFVLRGLRERIRSDRPIILSEMLDFTRTSYGSEQDFRKCFYDDALFFNVEAIGLSMRYKLSPFSFTQSGEVLVLPSEMAEFARR